LASGSGDHVTGFSEGQSTSDTPPSVASAHCTLPNSYGVYCIYPAGKLSYSLDELYSIDTVLDSVGLAKPENSEFQANSQPWWALPSPSDLSTWKQNYFHPFPNMSIFHLMTWFYDGSSTKSLLDLDNLVENVILAADFDKLDFLNFYALHEAQHLDKSQDLMSCFSAEDGWNEIEVEISVPVQYVKHAFEDQAPKFKVPGLYYC
jgi:hypothetical protein